MSCIYYLRRGKVNCSTPPPSKKASQSKSKLHTVVQPRLGPIRFLHDNTRACACACQTREQAPLQIFKNVVCLLHEKLHSFKQHTHARTHAHTQKHTEQRKNKQRVSLANTFDRSSSRPILWHKCRQAPHMHRGCRLAGWKSKVGQPEKLVHHKLKHLVVPVVVQWKVARREHMRHSLH